MPEQPIHEGPKEILWQDGAPCPKTPPWPTRTARLTGLFFLPVFLMAVIVLFEQSLWKLFLWLAAAFALVVPLRYFVCARCPYYGKDCSSSFGKLTPKFFAHQAGKSMKAGLWGDVAAVAFLLIFPLPEVKAFGGWTAVWLWLALFFLLFVFLSRLACSPCPLTFCPIGKAGRAFWNFLDGGKDPGGAS